MSGIFNFLIFVLVVIIVISFIRQPNKEYHSHWSQLLPNFKFSTLEFYELVKKELSSHEIENLKFEEASITTGSIVSSKRLYLRIRWQDYFYDLCFAPFGDGCFVSWWLMYETSPNEEFFTKLPFIGGWIGRAFFRKTYYKIDTASMFMTYSHHSVLAVIDEITKSSGIRLSEDQRKPNLNDIFKR